MKLERLTYVHDGNPGNLGQLISEARGTLRFGGEGSGLIEIDRSGGASQPAPSPLDVAVRFTSVSFSMLPPDVQNEIGGDQLPCLLAHSGTNTVVLLPPRTIARVTGGLSDLRGKIRFGLARIGWEL